MINADKGLITRERLTAYTVSLSFYKERVLFSRSYRACTLEILSANVL